MAFCDPDFIAARYATIDAGVWRMVAGFIQLIKILVLILRKHVWILVDSHFISFVIRERKSYQIYIAANSQIVTIGMRWKIAAKIFPVA